MKSTMDDVVVERITRDGVVRGYDGEYRVTYVTYVVRPESNPGLGLPEAIYTRRGVGHPLRGTDEEVEAMERKIAYRALEHRLIEDGYIEKR